MRITSHSVVLPFVRCFSRYFSISLDIWELFQQLSRTVTRRRSVGRKGDIAPGLIFFVQRIDIFFTFVGVLRLLENKRVSDRYFYTLREARTWSKAAKRSLVHIEPADSSVLNVGFVKIHLRGCPNLRRGSGRRSYPSSLGFTLSVTHLASQSYDHYHIRLSLLRYVTYS